MFRVCLLIVQCFVAGFSALNCSIDVEVEQYFVEYGFHRLLSYNIILKKNENFHLYDSCMVGLNQELPSGIFANPDELQDLGRIQEVIAIVRKRVNTELIAEEASPTNVFITGLLVNGKAATWLPVHARYHRARPGGGFVSNKIDNPKLYIRCPNNKQDQCVKEPSMNYLCVQNDCSWRQIPITKATRGLNLEVPVGNTSAYTQVTAATAVVVIFGSLYLLKTLHDYKIMSKKIYA